MPTFAENLKRARQRKKLSADGAAELCGVARSTWFTYENGTRKPPLDSLLKIADALDTTASKLLQGVGHHGA